MTATTQLEALALERLAFGPRPGEVDALKKVGFSAWLETQLNPPAGDDDFAREALLSTLLPIGYTKNGQRIVENRPLRLLGKTMPELWPLHDNVDQPIAAERFRPAAEVKAAALKRAVAARYQLREVMVRFWHDHFSIDAMALDEIAVGMPVLDRDVIRAHALGNFHDLVLGVGKSTAMLFFLSQQSSAKAHPNENYARELMELHTLGIGNYRGRGTPGAPSVDASGYTDQDVTEAARALTGWSVANGREIKGGSLPDTGEFYYVAAIHDTGIKRPLGLALGTTVAGEGEGDAIVTALVRSPATARFVCTKLCRRLVADDPPSSVVDRAVAAWIANLDSANQIREVVRAIATSPEFAASAGAKIKTPFEFVVSFLRATQIDWQPNQKLFALLAEMGYPLHEWPTPDGVPDVAAPWVGVSSLTCRWNTVPRMTETGSKIITGNLSATTPATAQTAAAVADFWMAAMLGDKAGDADRAAVAQFLTDADPFLEGAAFGSTAKLETATRRTVALIAALPSFQYR